MNEISRRRLALACCAAMAFAVSACGDDGAGTANDARKTCGNEVCTESQDCIDSVFSAQFWPVHSALIWPPGIIPRNRSISTAKRGGIHREM